MKHATSSSDPSQSGRQVRRQLGRPGAERRDVLAALVALLGLATTACPPTIPDNPPGTVTMKQLPWLVPRLLAYVEHQLGAGRPADFHRGRWADALVALRKARNRRPHDHQILLLGARVSRQLGERATTKGEQFKYANQGLGFSRVGRKHFPGVAAFHYYYAALLGLRVDAFRASAMSAVPEIRAACQRAIALEPGLDHGGPLRVLGSLLVRVPATAPFHGDMDKGIALLRRAVLLAPDYPLNHFFLADALAQDDERKPAITHYRRVLCAPLGPDWDATLARSYQTRTRQALSRLKATAEPCPRPVDAPPPPRR